MNNRSKSRQRLTSVDFLIDNIFPWVVLAILFAYTYVLFILYSYTGFDFDPSDGTIESVFVHAQTDADLQVGDRLIKVGQVAFADYLSNNRLALFAELQTGQLLPILIQRGDDARLIPWVIPGPNLQEIQYRLINIWLLAYVFWVCGLAVKYSVRPKDSQWRLLILFFFLTAIWLISGFVSPSKLWMSQIVFRSAIWLSIPVVLHLHWHMPKSLGKIPAAILWSGYAIFIALAMAEWFLVMPRLSYVYGAVFLFMGGVTLIGLHFFLHPVQRKELSILGLAFLVALFPLLVVSLASMYSSYPPAENFSVLALPVLPAAYFYVISRKKLGLLELRSNRFLSSYIFFVLLGMVIFTIMPLLDSLYKVSISPLFPSMAVALLSGLFVVVAFPRFERWMDHRIFGIKLLPDRLIDEYSTRISTSLDVKEIIHQLRDEFLPSLLIRQSALLRLHGRNSATVLYADGNELLELHGIVEIDTLWENAGKYIPPADSQLPIFFPWVRMVLAMQVGGERVGLWLLGQKDPDDFYAQAEITMLQAIANQTASALVNADQASLLHAMYQANIERHEEERIELASDLHDEVLNQLAVLSMSMGGRHSPEVEARFQKVNDYIRRIISDLRPVMLNYGLLAALEEMADEISDRSGNSIAVRLELAASQVRYDNKIESHLYRIVQQATENAIRHSKGNVVRIHGDFKPQAVLLVIEDDGVGFPDTQQLNFQRFLEDRHFGLARMFERAKIIGADLQIQSSPGRGTKITIEWPSNGTIPPLRV